VLVAASNDVVPVAQSFQKLNFIINTIDSSSKCHDELHNVQLVELALALVINEVETAPGANQICALKRAGDTRWGSHLGSICSLLDMLLQ
jgi:hypothetical protein